MRLAAPGPQLGAGRLRVDAARAIAKLREYQLANRAAWVLEAIRAAVASGATRIELTADANDVWLAWDGEPWAADDLPRLLDELVSPDGERHAHRLLAAAVNSALGMAPVYVDVTSIGDSAMRARYTPDVLASADALHALTADEIDAPRARGERGMLVHLRRRLTGSYFLGEPPELQLARDACRELAVPITIQGEPPAPHRDVVRHPLGDTLAGFVAVVEPGAHPYHTVVVEVAELGVRLTSYALDLRTITARAPLPLRLYIDAPRMPTNASRSQVRRDSFPIADAEARVEQLIPILIEKLDDSPRGRAAALALVASQIAGPTWRLDAGSLVGAFRALADRRLLRDACGTPHPITHPWRGEVHTGRSPFGPELASRLANVPWIRPDDPEAVLLAGAPPDQRALRRLARWARQQVRAEQRFFTHARRPPRVSAHRSARVQVALGAAVADSCMPDSVFDGMTGEVCVHAEPGHGELVVLLHGRELERISYDAQVGFEVVIDTERATPDERYRGLLRDAYYVAIERAMRAGVVRAVESLVGAADFGPSDLVLVRSAMQLVRELGGMMRGPLARAAIWRTREGDRVSTEALREQLVVAVVSQPEPWHVPPGRAAVIATPEERTLLSRLLGDRAVDYDRAGEVNEPLLAVHAMASGSHALMIRHPGLVAAIGPATAPLLVLCHRGRELDRRGYTPSLLPCTISVDADAIVPDALFRGVVDAAGLRERNYHEWEIALVRAVARAALGHEVPDLRGTVERGLDRTLCSAIAQADPRELLGDELHAQLQDLPAAPLLGEVMPRTLRELAAAFPHTIVHVPPASVPLAGFTAVAADDEVALAIARLCNRGIHDGSADLERCHREARFETRLAAHRAQPVRALELDGPYVAFETKLGKGVLGMSASTFVIDVLVDGRPFVTLQGPDDLPLRAIVDLPLAHAGTLERLPDETIDRLLRMLRRAIPPLIVASAEKMPELLGDPGPARTFVARWTERGKLDQDLRDAVRRARAFRTVQGGRVSIDEAGQPLLVVSVARWEGEWLAGEPDALDAPVIAIGDDSREITTIVDAVHLGAVVDVTAEVARLQARRRMARGLLPRPRVHGIAPAYVANLEELPSGKGLGAGEIGLADGNSLALIHVDGQPTRTIQLSLAPAIHVAIEQSEMPQAGRLQRLAAELVRRVLATTDRGALPGRLRRSLARGLLAGVLAPDDVGDTLVLEVAGGSWVPWGALLAQHDLYGDIWATTEVHLGFPLDPRRLVFRLDAEEIAAGRARGLPLRDAAPELRLDAIARTNLARVPEPALVMPFVHEFARVPLDGDGLTGPRGTVLPLLPGEHARALVHVHRKMVRLGEHAVECGWPTAAVIDDARITLDRTLGAPVFDRVWDAIAAKIREASERGIAEAVAIPDGVLAGIRVDAAAYAGLAAFRDPKQFAARGALWLVAQPPGAPVAIRVIHTFGERTFTPKRGIAMAGTLFVHTASATALDDALDQLAAALHALLLRQLIPRGDDAVARAHLAHGLRLGRLISTEVAHLDLREPARIADVPAPSHPVEPLVAALVERLGDVGIHRVSWRIANRAEPIVAYDDMLVIGGDNARLRSLATSLDSPWFDGALDALTAHVVSVLNIALTEITDATELHALGKLLSRPSAGPPRSRQSS